MSSGAEDAVAEAEEAVSRRQGRETSIQMLKKTMSRVGLKRVSASKRMVKVPLGVSPGTESAEKGGGAHVGRR